MPDLFFVTSGKAPEKFKGAVPVVPDLAVEVWSPSDTPEKNQAKIEAYQAAGVRLIWSVYQVAKYVIVHRLNDPDIKLFNSFNGELDGGDVIPGFKLKVSNLFQ